jgi:uncharacterized membrane protein YphA (DoxX/SURF4 family)
MNSSVNTVFNILKYTFGLVPIVAGLDKFTNLLTDWSHYLGTGIADLLPMDTGAIMTVVGIIEIAAGILVLINTKTGAIVVSLWLVLIALALILSGHYLDVAVRDLVMGIAAFCLFILAKGNSSS